MKLSHIFAATGLLIASLGMTTAAGAQPYRGDRHYQDDRRDDRHDDRRYERGDRYGHDQRRGHPQRCRTEWRHHHRVRICR